MEADRKRELILEKAALRFAHFGIQKTTMNEIAEDLAISKPLVYYYFPDKVSLVVAVVEKILAEYQERLIALFAKSKDVKDAIFSMLDLRREFLQKYFMLHLGDQTDLHLTKQELKESILHIRKREINLIKEVFDRGVELSMIKLDNTESAAELFIDMLAGINICVLARREKQLVPDDQGFEEVLTKQKELSRIFLNGIKN
ncbi:MAG: TetR/AcrR family transcriptional regulator [Sphingobacteriaceae bacterium]